MLKLAPPIWTLLYLVLCVVLSWSLDWPTIPGLPLPLLGIALVALAFIPPVWAGGPRSYAMIPSAQDANGKSILHVTISCVLGPVGDIFAVI